MILTRKKWLVVTPGVHFIPLALRTSSPYALPNPMTIRIFIVTSSLCCLFENVDQYEVYCSRLLSDLDCFRQTFESIPMVQPCTSVHSDQNTWTSFHFHFQSVAVHTKLFIRIKTRGILSTSRFSARSSLAVPPPLLAPVHNNGQGSRINEDGDSRDVTHITSRPCASLYDPDSIDDKKPVNPEPSTSLSSRRPRTYRYAKAP